MGQQPRRSSRIEGMEVLATDYRDAGAPYGDTVAGFLRWVKEQHANQRPLSEIKQGPHRPVPRDPRHVKPL